jgi:Zn-dependent peptidase ImmA (M78 family)
MERGFKAKCENIAIQVREELGLQKYAPLDPHALAKHFGVLVWTPYDVEGLSQGALNALLKNDRDSWSAVTISYSGLDLVIYNPTHPKSRQSSDIMHELAHLILGHKPDEMMLLLEGQQIILREYNQELEDEAIWLCGCLLLPRGALLRIGKNSMSIGDVCKQYGVSDDLFIFRMNMTGVNHQLIAASKK